MYNRGVLASCLRTFSCPLKVYCLLWSRIEPLERVRVRLPSVRVYVRQARMYVYWAAALDQVASRVGRAHS